MLLAIEIAVAMMVLALGSISLQIGLQRKEAHWIVPAIGGIVFLCCLIVAAIVGADAFERINQTLADIGPIS